ncbi:TIGR01841 family phasin [Paraburkholderia graminis]|uniref:Phasin family protein n=1 Tax=Paraburkholderia graminis TaxID=60548 RepID=A0ABD5CTE5_9BURK|nr:TIGR01841 family phasin [Paraburkholderia graminis]MDR6207915.1 phasin family protein [Paraburkholderia graminis]
MTQLIPEQWLSAQAESFGRLFGITRSGCDAFERLTALNLEAMRFGVAETQQAMSRMGAAHSLPEVLSLPTLLAPVGLAQALSYSRQYCKILSELQQDVVPPQSVDAARQTPLANSVIGSLAARSLASCEVPARSAVSLAGAAPAAAEAGIERKKKRPHEIATPPIQSK